MNPPPLANPFQTMRLNGTQDYRPEWDVPSFNAHVSDWLEGVIRSLRGQEQPNPGLVLPVLLAPPGYGKTHLFGRIAHRLGQEALFVFVPQIEDVRRPLDHIRWHVVESLYRSRPGEPSHLVRILARLCRDSLVKYLEDLPPSLEARHQPLREKLREEPLAALEVVECVTELQPFLKLADSVAKAFGELRADVLRALLLGWSPESAAARRWLRGETLPENDQLWLGLGDEPPQAGQVLEAIARLLRFQMPIVLCCDQLEAVLAQPDEGPMHLSVALMGLLQAVPNQLVVLSCLKDKWRDFLDRTHGSFKRRVHVFELLDGLTENQAVELLRRRLADWPRAGTNRDGLWPFVDQGIREFAQRQQVPPHGLMKVCADSFERWMEDGKDTDIDIRLKSDGDDDLTALFVRAWNQEMEAIRQDSERSPTSLQEDRLFRSVKETLELAREAKWEVGGVRVEALEEGAIRATGNERRPSLKLRVCSSDVSFSLVVGVTKLDNGAKFRGYYSALDAARKETAGAVLVHPASELRMGPVTQQAVDEAREQGTLRTYPLVEHGESFARMECLLSLLDRARRREFQLGGQNLSDDDCRDLTLKSGVMANVDFLEAVCAGWPTSKGGAGRKMRVTEAESPIVDGAATATAVLEAPARVLESESWAEERLGQMVDKLRQWGLPVVGDGVEVGPTFARLRVRPQGKTGVNRIRNKVEDLKVHLGLDNRPLVGAQAGFISVDVQLPERKALRLDQTMAEPVGNVGDPVFPVGQDVAGKTHWLNLAEPSDCHLLVAGTTGSGKSEFLKAMLASLVRRHGYEQLQFVLVDPKQVTFNFAGESPYFRRPVAHQAEEALHVIQECFAEAERRYKLLKVRNLEHLGQLDGPDALPRLVVVIDEFADLMAEKESKRELEKPLKRMGAMARAAGIHLVLATQRPEASVVTPLLRSNLPGRISLKVSSEADSKLILGTGDACYLLGRGDLLWKHGGGLVRLQSPFVSREELDRDLRLS